MYAFEVGMAEAEDIADVVGNQDHDQDPDNGVDDDERNPRKKAQVYFELKGIVVGLNPVSEQGDEHTPALHDLELELDLVVQLVQNIEICDAFFEQRDVIGQDAVAGRVEQLLDEAENQEEFQQELVPRILRRKVAVVENAALLAWRLVEDYFVELLLDQLAQIYLVDNKL